MKTFVSALLLFCWSLMDGYSQPLASDTLAGLFREELARFPQEKISIHTDRRAYLSGERVWLRTHLVDALTHRPVCPGRYVYVELLSPVCGLIERVKLRADSLGCFHGYVDLPAGLPEGMYTLRAYTRFMRNLSPDYFAHHALFVTDPASRALTPRFTSLRSTRRGVEARICFTSPDRTDTIVPAEALLFPDGDPEGPSRPLEFAGGTAAVFFPKSSSFPSRPVLLQTLWQGRVSRRYLMPPPSPDSFSVTFHPEGGTAVQGVPTRIAFRALGTDGHPVDVTGQVYDDQGRLCTTFSTFRLGLGSFVLNIQPGRRYHALCRNSQGARCSFPLPEASSEAVSIRAQWQGERLRVSLLRAPSDTVARSLYLLAHVRGWVVSVLPWPATQPFVDFSSEAFPAGVAHLVLIDSQRRILSERLVFSRRDEVVARVAPSGSVRAVSPRRPVSLDFRLTSASGLPLQAHCSVAVTDAADVPCDSVSSLLSTLLLTSELRGSVEQPLSYFRSDRASAYSLDLLLLTQGWRRYDIPSLVRGQLSPPPVYTSEPSGEVSGRVEGYFSASRGAEVSLLAMRDSVIGTQVTRTDAKGRFRFQGVEYPAGTRYIVQALKTDRRHGLFIRLDSLHSLPSPRLKLLPPRLPLSLPADVVRKMDSRYLQNGGMRVYELDEIEVTARRKASEALSSPYYSLSVSKVMTEEDIAEGHFLSVLDIIRRLPGVNVTGSGVRYRGGTPMVLLDDVPEEDFDYDRIDVDQVASVFFSPPAFVGSLFGAAAQSGAIVIQTKSGFVERNRLNSNLAVQTFLGYQEPAEFYVPAYDTPERQDSAVPDLRSTLYWNPVVATDEEGTVRLRFTTADTTTSFRVVMEGTCEDGTIVEYEAEFPGPLPTDADAGHVREER